MGKINRRHRSRRRRRGGEALGTHVHHAKEVVLGHETRKERAKNKVKGAMGKVTSGAKNLMNKFKGLFGGRRRTRKRRRRRRKRRRRRRRRTKRRSRTKRHHRRLRRRTRRRRR